MKSSPRVQAVHDLVRKDVPKLENDRYIYKDMALLKELVHHGSIVTTVEKLVGKLKF